MEWVARVGPPVDRAEARREGPVSTGSEAIVSRERDLRRSGPSRHRRFRSAVVTATNLHGYIQGHERFPASPDDGVLLEDDGLTGPDELGLEGVVEALLRCERRADEQAVRRGGLS